MTRHYCTYFDRNYLTRGLAMIESLTRAEPAGCVVFVVCLDEMTHLTLRRLAIPNVRLIPLHDVEARDRALLAVKPGRTLVEYYWTLTPTVILRVLERHPEIDVLTYLDADLYFFSSPQPMFDELGRASILIHEHRFSPRQADLATHNGRYNVGLLMFRRDAAGLLALRWWRERCLEWCYARHEQGKMGDQLYLNDWPERFPGVVVLRHLGGGVGPWNHDQYEIGRSSDGTLLVEGQPLIFYHFHSLKLASPDLALPVAHAHYPLTMAVLQDCVAPYLETLRAASARTAQIVPTQRWGFEPSVTVSPPLTFMAQRRLRDRFASAAASHRLVAVTEQWDAYCSSQVIEPERRTAMQSSPPHETVRSAGAAGMKTADPPTPVPTQHDLLSSLRGTDLARRVKTLYVVGAHRFQERELFDQLFPSLERICLFEPIKELAEFLRRFERLDPRVKVFPYALSDEEGQREFFITNNDGESSSLLRLGKHKEIFPHVREVGSVSVTCRRLEHVIVEQGLPAPDLLLLDVQGAEYQILSSLSERLKAGLLLLYVEASLEEVYAGAKCLNDLKACLQPHHELVAFAPLGPDSPTHGNALFVNRAARQTACLPIQQPQEANEPLVSVIVSSYGAEAFMRECLTDLERQTIADKMEMIVVDAASPEQEGAIVLEFQRRHRNIHYLRTAKRIGVYAAWNAALKLARGRYVTPFSTNDRLRPDAYEILARTLDDRPEVALVYGDTYLTERPHQTFERHERSGIWRWPEYQYEFLLRHCTVGPHPMWRRAVHDTVGYFDESYVALGDQDFWIRLGASHRLLHVPVVTGLYWKSPDGLSNRAEIAGPEERRLRTTYAAALGKNGEAPAQPSQPQFDCSVIIPVWNRCELTKECVQALANTTQDVSWELIVVDNHSTDGTQAFLATLGGDVQVIRNQDNLGFAKGCNQGAHAARGKYLVFLNNDTVPLKGWLKALVDEVERHPDVAIVGSKLLYGDGTIQHAGVVISRRHLMPYHVYRQLPGDHPAVNRRREFQVVTAACMLIRRERFHEAGGFDEAFRNGFEDVDLCLKVRERGHRIIYQPSSALYHLESQTQGRKLHDDANARLLQARWGRCWWLGDEDRYYHEDGYKCVYGVEDGKSFVSGLQLFANEQDRAAWAQVVKVEEAAIQKDWAAVRRALSTVEQWPDDAAVLSWAEMVCRELHEPALAERFRCRALEREDSSASRVERIRTLVERRDFHSAEQEVKTLLVADPMNRDGWLMSGVLAMQREDYEEAKRAFAAALQYGADAGKCLKGKGMACLGAKDYAGAWEEFVQALAQGPDDAEAVHWLLRAGTASGRWNDLSRVLSAFLSRKPGALDVRFALAGVLVRAGLTEQARRECDAIQALAPAYDGLTELRRAIEDRGAVAPAQAANW